MTSIDPEADADLNLIGQPRRRASSPANRDRIAARRLAAEMKRRIADWNYRLPTLRAAIESQRGDQRALRAEAAKLLALVVAARIEFSALIKDKDAAIAQHSIVQDVMHSLDTLRLQLEEMAGQLAAIDQTTHWPKSETA